MVIFHSYVNVYQREPYFQTPYAEDDKGRQMSMRRQQQDDVADFKTLESLEEALLHAGINTYRTYW